jgi:hypothetical protein
MKLEVAGVEYDYGTALNKIGLKHLYDMKVQAGIGKRTVVQALDLFDEGLRAEEGQTPAQRESRVQEILEDERILLGLTGLVFICKRFAGEQITFDEAGQFGFGDVRFVADESDLVSEPDPTAALAVVPRQGSDGEPNRNVTRQPPKKSKTSKPRSISA